MRSTGNESGTRSRMQNVQSFEILPGNDDTGLILLADHATNRLPERYGSLDLPPEAFARHIAYDIGIEGLTRALSASLGAPAVLSCFSRLLIDPNRGEDDPTLIMKISDGAIVPGNHPITPEEWNYRLATYHRPYHQAVARTIRAVEARTGKAPLVLSLHSFTPFWKGVPRPWHAGILWDSDPRAAVDLIARLRADDSLVVGDNEPYDGALAGDTMSRHATANGLAHALVEIRQDLIADDAGALAWARRLAPIVDVINSRPDIHELNMFGSRTDPSVAAEAKEARR